MYKPDLYSCVKGNEPQAIEETAMQTLNKALLLTVCGVLLSTGANAASVEIEWVNPDGFRDIRAVDINQQRFRERVLNELEEQFRREAAKLPAEQSLHIAVNDVDLAGEIEYFHNNHPFGLRVIRRVDAPSLSLSYELRDSSDAVLQSGEGTVRDSSFRSTTLMPVDRSILRYEKALIRDWYQKAF
jgi:hypothetical protein